MGQATIPNYSGCIQRWTRQEDPTLQATRNACSLQAWIYKTFPSLDGIVVTRISRVHHRIVNWMVDERPSAAKLEGPDCFSNPKVKFQHERSLVHKSVQPTSSSENRRRTKHMTETSVEDANTSEKSIPSVLSLMDSNIGQTHSSDYDDDFVAPPPRRQEPSAYEKSPFVEGPTVAHHSQEEPQSHRAQWDDETQKRVDSIISDVVTATKTVENEGSPIAEPTSELPVKRVLRPARVLQSPFVARQERGKLFKHDDNIVIFEDYKDNVDEVDKSAIMGWSQRGYKPKNKKKFSEEDDAIKPACLIGSFPVGDWKVLQGIETYIKVLPALMNTLRISKKDPDYHELEAKELKVIIDDTLPQQTNGHDYRIFVVLYTLYLIRGGRCSVPKKFDASKFRMDIATLLYKHRQVYTKRVNQPMMEEALVIE
ncbi:Hypothetical predicted protein [Olea europaea subsp. europaea]|uniref:Uncharacterized protein n=1 Tax=Olea europaea subsp. europaea TaxID=158383 RepID=A0A8S0SQI3_OLEEU|nr:Hypothetical predicted protein [Olea europaea subsp. europaea]